MYIALLYSAAGFSNSFRWLELCFKGGQDMELPNSKMLKHEEKDTRDRISELSDDVLVKILSFLPSEEAVLKTSFLSRRWKQLWESLPVSFNLDGLMAVHNGAYAISFDDSKNCRRKQAEDLKIERCKFVGLVNDVLIAHQGSTIDELVLLGPWFAALYRQMDRDCNEKEGQKAGTGFSGMYYLFPQKCFCGIEFLTSLCLKHAGVSDVVTNWILSNCPMLESLHIEGSPLLRDPKVSGSSLRLKHLHISKAFALTIPILRCQINYLPQLETLRLSMQLPSGIRDFPTCTNLRHLSCKVEIQLGERLFTLRFLIEASPFLHKFSLEALDMSYSKEFAEITHQMAHESAPSTHGTSP
ncbi:hypothetical protein V6N13_014492 [Hibiscus sabdariffa]